MSKPNFFMGKFQRLWIPLGAALFFLWVGMWLVGAPATSARPNPGSVAALVVTTLEDELNDDGDCSLREAIQAANTNTAADACGPGDILSDLITFEITGTINLTGQLSVDAGGPLEIDGGAAVTISGGDSVGIFNVITDTELTLQNLVLINGWASTGGGIYNSGTLTLTNSLLSRNQAINGGGAIENWGVMNITGSNLEYNSVWGGGGAIGNWGVMNITDSTLLGNSAEYGGGIDNLGTLTITGSLLTANFAFNSGGIENYLSGTVSITNSTLSGNSASNCGGGLLNYTGPVTILNSTLTGNTAACGGGILDYTGTLVIANSIVANNPSGGDCWPTVIDAGHNISSDDTCGFDPANGSLPNTDPLLRALKDNGGPTWTHALAQNSPAIDLGDDAQCPSTDQRGVTRPLDGNRDGMAVCDIGSFEYWIPITYIPLVVKNTIPR